MYQLLLVLHTLIAVTIIGLVLIQHGKGADIGAAFGSGASNTVFGSQGTGSFLFRLTSGLALAFFITSVTLSAIIAHYYQREHALVINKQPIHVPVSNIPIPQDAAK